MGILINKNLDKKLPEEILNLYQDIEIKIFNVYHLDLLSPEGFIETSTFSDYHGISAYLKKKFRLNQIDHQHLLLTLLYNRKIFSDFPILSDYIYNKP